MRKKILVLMMLVVFAVFSWGGGQKSTGGTVYLRMYYPVGVAGSLAQLMDGLVEEFNKAQNEVYVESIFAGGYMEAMDKAQTAFLAGNPPELAVLDAPNLLTLMDIDAVVPLDEYIAKEGGEAYIANFLEGFMKIARYDGKIWSIPWQRSTPIMYFNRDAYTEVGLDPEKAASTWDELTSYSQKLTATDSGGNVTRWGVLIPNDYWLVKPLLLQAGGEADNEAGTYIAVDTEEMRVVYRFLNKLAYQLKVTTGVTPWSQSVSDFATGKTAMLYHSTGAMTYIRNSTTYDFGAAYLPKYKRQVNIEGGGNFFIFKTDERRQAAAWKAIKWLTGPENTAKWSAGSGYIPVRKEAFELPDYKAYTDKWPQALVAYHQLIYTDIERNMMTHRMQEIYDMLNVLDEKIRGSNDSAFMDQALREAQAEADKILAKWK
jgi:sn-glycerol 3-phosphate transport system substrate-binding protein